ncbi:MAG TPA: hypothetical protein PK760_00770 [Flavobacteriales bacterium]|nr:hypothetical protein [Flavobacteriales bacterium]
MEIVSDNVSIERTPGRLSVVISGRTSRGKQSLLVTWALAWIACGIIVIVERNKLPEADPARQYMLAFLAFWAYFAVSIGRAVLWRLKGFELWRVKDGTLLVKDSILGFGKANTYFVDNIQKLGLITVEETSFKWQWNQSAWVIGGERIGFEHTVKKVVIGKNLTEAEAKRLVTVLKDVLKEQRKKAEVSTTAGA